MGGIELIESSVSGSSHANGKQVKDIDWPEDCILVAILHGTRGQVPAASDEITEGDSVYALVGPKAKRKFLKLISP